MPREANHKKSSIVVKYSSSLVKPLFKYPFSAHIDRNKNGTCGHGSPFYFPTG
ncbi:hypothetical protein TUMSATVNIG1_18040 [Vibrio nigripulchritudo]|nr:hypothetical protein VNTUMSATTG_17860 [Vibrio nigripulchritudo]BDU31195.1 hypothetical protein TUMSATVNIG1_18040 [Vibrio nigripulchritudo]